MLNNQSYLQDFGLLTELTSEESAAISGGAKVSETIGGGIGVAIGTSFG
ncbi:hypothetical protein [Nostoc commune]|nr:hypothetical protein [Nostoc commune]